MWLSKDYILKQKKATLSVSRQSSDLKYFERKKSLINNYWIPENY